MVADEVWAALGNPRHYIEPFLGSAAVLLGRPHRLAPDITETVNDADGMLINVWRSIRLSPDVVAAHLAGVPPATLEICARANRIRAAQDSLVAELKADPEAHDALIAADWIYGACACIGQDWSRSLPQQHLGDAGRGWLRQSGHCG